MHARRPVPSRSRRTRAAIRTTTRHSRGTRRDRAVGDATSASRLEILSALGDASSCREFPGAADPALKLLTQAESAASASERGRVGERARSSDGHLGRACQGALSRRVRLGRCCRRRDSHAPPTHTCRIERRRRAWRRQGSTNTSFEPASAAIGMRRPRVGASGASSSTGRPRR